MADFKTKIVNFRVTPERFDTLKLAVEMRSPWIKSISDLIERALMVWLEQNPIDLSRTKPEAAATTPEAVECPEAVDKPTKPKKRYYGAILPKDKKPATNKTKAKKRKTAAK